MGLISLREYMVQIDFIFLDCKVHLKNDKIYIFSLFYFQTAEKRQVNN